MINLTEVLNIFRHMKMYSILVGTLHKSTSRLYIILSEYDCCADNIIHSGGIYTYTYVHNQCKLEVGGLTF